MEGVLKYFEIKHNIRDTLEFDEKVGNAVHSFSISKSKILQVFFTTVLEYYYVNTIPLDYSDESVSDDTKIAVMKKMYPSVPKSKHMFDLVDFMFKTFKRVLLRSHTGFLKWLAEPDVRPVQFAGILMPNIDLFFYVIFIQVFPEDLREMLRKELRIQDVEYNILNRCRGILIRNNARICNLKTSQHTALSSPVYSRLDIDSIKEKSSISFSPTKAAKEDLSLEKPGGLMMMIKLFNDLRQFSKRRSSLMDDFTY